MGVGRGAPFRNALSRGHQALRAETRHLLRDVAVEPGAGTAPLPTGGVERGRELVTAGPKPDGTAHGGFPWRASASDVALAALVAVLSLVSFTERASVWFDTADGPVHFASPDPLGAAQVLVGCVALVWRRSAPGVVLLVCVASAVGRYAEHYPVMPLPYAVLVAVYTVAQLWPLRRSAVAVALVAVAMAASAFALLSPSLDDEPMIDAVAVITAGALGRGVRMRQGRTALLEERAGLLEKQSRQLTQEQATLAELAATRERATIARELHDIVANNVSVIVAHAGANRRRRDQDNGEGAVHALGTIEALGRETLRDMRALVGVLRGAEARPAGNPQPRLDQLPALVDKVAAAGVDASLTVTGTQRELPALVELNAYRIVQESLTNAMKHAAGSRVQVHVDHGRDLLRLRVRDFGAGAAAGSAHGKGLGSGLVGMRQRIALLGGTLSAAPHPGGGFVVEAQIPVQGSSGVSHPPPPPADPGGDR